MCFLIDLRDIVTSMKNNELNEVMYGYYTFILCKDGKIRSLKAHRLVAEAFIPNEDNKPEIDHINTIRSDNRVENLRWATSKENSNNPLSLNNYSMGQKKRFGLLC